MCNHRSLFSTSDVAARLSVSCSHVIQGRYHAQLLLTAVALIGVSLILGASASAAGPAGSLNVPQGAEGAKAPDTDPLLALVDEALAKNSQRFLSTSTNSPWEMAHGLIALRKDLMLRDGGQMVNAIDWLSNKATYKGIPIFEKNEYGGRAHPYNGTMYDFEGHINQTLALLSMSNLPLTHTFTLPDGTKLTMADMVRGAQMSTNREEETTWTLWFLTHYLDPEAEWTNKYGHQWSMAALVILQNRVEVTKAACGGTHNLFALAYARNAYYQKHGRLRGVWLEADQKIQEHLRMVRQLQNADGSFSTSFFKGRGHSVDPNERMKSTGHNLEWIMMALPQQRLGEEWVRSAVRSLAVDLIRTAPYPADYGHGGPLYHSIDALVLYRQRVSDPSTFAADRPLASLKKIEESRRLAAAPGAVPPASANPAAPGSPAPQSSVSTPAPALSKESGTQAAPKPLTINVNGRPVRVAELPQKAVSDSPAPLAPVPAPPAAPETPEQKQPAVAAESPEMKTADNPLAVPVQVNPGPSKVVPEKPVQEKASVEVPLPAPMTVDPNVDFAQQAPAQEARESMGIRPLAPGKQSVELPGNDQPGKVESGLNAPSLPAEAEVDGEVQESNSRRPVRERPHVTAPRDVFVPLRRRYLQNRR